jgi:hypothetical protein
MAVELNRDEINSVVSLPSKVRQGAFEAPLAKRRSQVRLQSTVHFFAAHWSKAPAA